MTRNKALCSNLGTNYQQTTMIKDKVMPISIIWHFSRYGRAQLSSRSSFQQHVFCSVPSNHFFLLCRADNNLSRAYLLSSENAQWPRSLTSETKCITTNAVNRHVYIEQSYMTYNILLPIQYFMVFYSSIPKWLPTEHSVLIGSHFLTV